MAIEDALYSLLAASGAVASHVGDRIYPVVRPQNSALPAIVYQQISGPRSHAMDGPSSLVESTWQVSCWAASYTQAEQLMDAVRSTLDGYSGTVAGVDIEGIFLIDVADLYNTEPKATQTFGKRMDIQVFYQE